MPADSRLCEQHRHQGHGRRQHRPLIHPRRRHGRLHKNDVGHRQERGRDDDNLGPDGRANVSEVEKTFERAVV
jgi:hypothetical protein